MFEERDARISQDKAQWSQILVSVGAVLCSPQRSTVL